MRRNYLRRLIRGAFWIVLFLCTWFIIHSVCIVVDGFSDDLTNTDVAVVLGNKVELNGQPSERLQSRLDKAVELYEKGKFPSIIVSGGVGKEGFDEAIVMKEYLVKKEVPEDDIIVDSNGYNTYMTAQNTKEIMDNNNYESVMVITQYFHISRTKLALKSVGINTISSASADIVQFRDLYSIFREFPAYYKYVFYY
ncbi:SanA/YdcF family protein [Aquibacillus kalidii]|uniref:SanA/YdcF family protein n=1 Tax=Aquibacillus kalidii TaxID=2762597 RepID=UPI002E2CB42F|nr:YdcF family protein [Aquibacillus kalidii]